MLASYLSPVYHSALFGGVSHVLLHAAKLTWHNITRSVQPARSINTRHMKPTLAILLGYRINALFPLCFAVAFNTSNCNRRHSIHCASPFVKEYGTNRGVT
jgi:hypothetical protein